MNSEDAPRTFYQDTETRSGVLWDTVVVTSVQGAFSAGLWAVGFHVNGAMLNYQFPKSYGGTFARSLIISVTSVTVVVAQMFSVGLVGSQWRTFRNSKNNTICRMDLETRDSKPYLRIASGRFCGGDVAMPLEEVTMKALPDGKCQLSTTANGDFTITNLSGKISDLETYKEFVAQVELESPPPVARQAETWTPLLTLDHFQEEPSIVDIQQDSKDYVAIHNGHDQYYVLPSSSLIGYWTRRDDKDYLSTRWELDLRYNSYPTMTHDGVLYCDFDRKIEQVSTNKYLNPHPTDTNSIYLEHTLVKE